MRLGIVTCEKCRGLIPSEQALLPQLLRHNIKGIPAVWNDTSVDWNSFDTLLVRSVWDYHLFPDQFVAWLSTVESMGLPVWNPVPVLRWNAHKFYLEDLANKNLPIAPTLFFRKGQSDALSQIDARGWQQFVVKPAISASAYRTVAVDRDNPRSLHALVEASQYGDFLVQPFVPEISRDGELSLIFFNQQFSHAALKRPAAGEFRVQAEHGGHEVRFQPDEQTIREASAILEHAAGETLYARVDGFRKDGAFQLMELELIEPDLFLELESGAGERFVKSLITRIESR